MSQAKLEKAKRNLERAKMKKEYHERCVWMYQDDIQHFETLIAELQQETKNNQKQLMLDLLYRMMREKILIMNTHFKKERL